MTAEIEPRVQAYYPTLPKIELFARGKARPGWAAWERKPSRRTLHDRLPRADHCRRSSNLNFVL